ncbi:unnamed protein product [Strongylus vulgaris]|uniref:Uncharacterized protein n=1 Tax=Strongylus vulgaris TaxID=40348 RepID=A0A3P7INU8_STRVU|nr:unnamed protein product [Strongylus vulgaris]
MPALFEPRKVALIRRSSTRQSIYAESIYGDMEESEEVSKETENGGVSSSTSSRPSSMSTRPLSSTNGYMETLTYQEHSTSAYRREATPTNRASDKEAVEFISWVEDNQYGRQTPSTQPATPSSQHDNDSLKSEKKRFSLFGKRGSKSQK